MSDFYPQDMRMGDDLRAKYWANRMRNAVLNPGPGRVLHLNPVEYHNLMTTPTALLAQFLDPNVIGVAAGTDITVVVDQVWSIGALNLRVVR